MENNSVTLLVIIQLIFSVCLVDLLKVTSEILISPKIVGGYPITINQAPYQVWIGIRSRHDVYFGDGGFCGGSVISQRVVLSAAHCFDLEIIPGNYLAKLLVVVAGGTYNDEPEKNTQEYHVQQLALHPLWDAKSLANDIAMIFLNGFIPWNSPTVIAIPLAEGPPNVGEICLTSGWGQKNEMDSSYVLQQGKVPIMNIEDCKLTYPWIKNSQICGGYYDGGVGPCFGDSGGPLICSNRLSGIVSFGLECGAPKIPVVYTNVSYFILWIREVNSTFDHSLYLLYSTACNNRRYSNLQIICLMILLLIYLLK